MSPCKAIIGANGLGPKRVLSETRAHKKEVDLTETVDYLERRMPGPVEGLAGAGRALGISASENRTHPPTHIHTRNAANMQ